MPDQLQKIILPVKSRWDALAKDQKIKLVAAIAVVLIALALTLYFMLRTQYTILYDNLDEVRIQPIQTVLNDQGIANRIAKNGTAIEVDRKKSVEAKLAANTSNALRGETFTYDDAFSMIGFGTTDLVTRRMMVLAQEDKLNNELLMFNGIRAAAVTLTIPEDIRLFQTDREQARAAVTLDVEYALTEAAGLSLARHIASSVEGLDMENISIYDQEYRVVYSGLAETAAKSAEGSINEIKAMERAVVTNDVRAAVQTGSGFAYVNVSPNLVYNNNTIRDTYEKHYILPAGSEVGLPDTERTESASGENTSPEDAPGTDTNNLEQPTYQAGTTGNSSFETESADVKRLYDIVESNSTEIPGSYERDGSSLAISAYVERKHFQEEYLRNNPEATELDWLLYQEENPQRLIIDYENEGRLIQLASAATGINMDNITLTVWEVPVFEPFYETPLDINLIIMLSLLGLLILMLAFALIRRQKPIEEEEEVEPELSVEDLLVSTQLEEAQEEAERLETIDYAKENEIKLQIEKFINEKPEAVAALLRNWLNAEEW
jgi:flagellar M-ring protein FliF